MEIYSLTGVGHNLARSTSNPDTPAWKVVHCLDTLKAGTREQIADWCGLSGGTTAAVIRILMKKRVVTEATRVEV